MNIFTVALFGHRYLESHLRAEEGLESAVRELLGSKDYVEFLIGREGEFDILAASVIRRCIDEYDGANASLVLVLPYEKAEVKNNAESMNALYDEIEILSNTVHFKSAITERNRAIVRRCDLVLCFVSHSGGAYSAYRYALFLGKRGINTACDKPV